jgi:lipopolysaccharide transport system permease protein
LADLVDTRAGFRERIADLVDYRELVLNLTQRDLILKYKGSFLGVAWSLLNPLLQMVIYTLVFSVFLRVFTLPHYWAFVIGGILFWTFFSTSLLASSTAFIRNPGLITRVYFPIEVLILSGIFANFINFLIPLALLLVVLPIGGVHLGISLICLPVIVLSILVTTVGLGLIAASITVFLRDVEHFLTLGLQVFFYATPILYPLHEGSLPHGASKYIQILRLNPLAWYLDSYHAVLYFGTWPNPKEFIAMLLFSVFCMVLGCVVFVRLRPRLPENL